eukprot:TRINITY_DN3952_c0_g1_i4.p1 TRINITY_DN3952_c0_g1~~TRINITY_DN3952_c0_g1_i4.p1  ORF type:complete len:158 (-),score=40.03 TRINITY_DN3952_c0_g1_i4:61-534(-)
MRIYNEYIALHAPFTVNISGDVKLRIENALGVVGKDKKVPIKFELNMDNIAQELSFHENSRTDVTETGVVFDAPVDVKIFDAAVQEVFSLMFKDSFRRFMHTQEYLEYLLSRSRRTEAQGFVATLKGTMRKFILDDTRVEVKATVANLSFRPHTESM